MGRKFQLSPCQSIWSGSSVYPPTYQGLSRGHSNLTCSLIKVFEEVTCRTSSKVTSWKDCFWTARRSFVASGISLAQRINIFFMLFLAKSIAPLDTCEKRIRKRQKHYILKERWFCTCCSCYCCLTPGRLLLISIIDKCNYPRV